MDDSELVYDVFDTSLGWIAAVMSHRGVVRMCLPEPTPDAAIDRCMPELEQAARDPERVSSVAAAVEAYCAGKRPDLSDVPVDMTGASQFFAQAWEACRTIPAGETRSYAWLAAAAGSPRAARGAGQAMARNRVPLLVPCHRVVGSDGTLHGFGGSGLGLKARLLELESTVSGTAAR